MSIRKGIDILKYAKRYPGSLSERWSVITILMGLSIKHWQYPSPTEPVSQKVFSHRMFGYDYKALDFLFKEVYIACDYNFQTSKSNPFIIDCGSNIGMSVSYFKWRYPNSKLIAFEANPEAYSLLIKNIEQNNFKTTEAHNVALSDTTGHISFFISEYKGTLTGSVHSSRGGEKELKVNAERLSSFLKDFDHVDLIKMDVEGAELPIVMDLCSSGAISRVEELIIEYHHNMPEETDSLANFLEMFESAGFHYNIRSNFFHLRDFQNVLLHFYRPK